MKPAPWNTEKKNRPDGEEWTPRGDWRNFLASLTAVVAYSVPWFVLQWRWPLFTPPPRQGFPPLLFTLGLGIGWFAAMVVLLVVVVPSLLAWARRGDLAWRLRGGAIHGAWFGLTVTSISTGMRLPLSLGLQVIATGALFTGELLAVRWLKRRLGDA
jgi:hypothetical protein